MEQQALDLTIDKVAPLETPLTDFRPGPPPCAGWWATKRVIECEGQRTFLSGERRYWDGKHWSCLVIPKIHSDPDARGAQFIHTTLPTELIRWAGLTEPHPDGYTADQWEELRKIYPAEVEALAVDPAFHPV